MSLPQPLRRVLALAAVGLLALPAVGLLALPAVALAAAPRVSFTQIENDLMCTLCHESLAVAQSPESYSERQLVRTLIAEGLTKQQIEAQMVSQYGPAVLARPPASGFNLTVYILPPLVVLIGTGIVLVTIPRWRRRSRERAQAPGALPAPPLEPADAQRLDQDLARQS
jgi:cytochrome c-type biogenesis protein CcmH/NrfF